MKAVVIHIIPTNGNKNELITPKSTPTLTMTIENSPLGAANTNAERNASGVFFLNIKLPVKLLTNFIAIVTEINIIATTI